MEIWKDVKGYNGDYQISNLGRVKSLKRKESKMLMLLLNSSGYSQVSLCVKGCVNNVMVHQLVAISFLKHTPKGHTLVVNHIDFNKLNNNVNNLEIITNRENLNRKHLKSTSKYTGVSWCKLGKKWKSQINIKGKTKYLGLFNTEISASSAYQKALKNV